MKPVAANAFVPERTRQCEALRNFRHRAVKSSVEAGDLRQAREVRSDRLNAGNLVGQMQRRKRDQTTQLIEERISNSFRSRVMRAAVYQSMTDCVGMREPQPLQLDGKRVQRC